MDGQQRFYQKCVCGAEINLADAYELVSWAKLGERFTQWQEQHAACLPLFHQVQKVRLQRLELAAGNQKLLNGER
jgi:hypothetical protein